MANEIFHSEKQDASRNASWWKVSKGSGTEYQTPSKPLPDRFKPSPWAVKRVSFSFNKEGLIPGYHSMKGLVLQASSDWWLASQETEQRWFEPGLV